MNVRVILDTHVPAGKSFRMRKADVRELLTAGQVAAVLHRSPGTISRWAKSGELPTLGRIAVGHGVYVFDPEVVKEKAMELALGPDRGITLDLDINESDGPKRRAS